MAAAAPESPSGQGDRPFYTSDMASPSHQHNIKRGTSHPTPPPPPFSLRHFGRGSACRTHLCGGTDKAFSLTHSHTGCTLRCASSLLPLQTDEHFCVTQTVDWTRTSFSWPSRKEGDLPALPTAWHFQLMASPHWVNHSMCLLWEWTQTNFLGDTCTHMPGATRTHSVPSTF